MNKKLLSLTLPIIFFLSSWTVLNTVKSTKAEETYMTKQMIELINDHRASIGLPELERCKFADKLAEEHTNTMINQSNVNNDGYETRWEALETEKNTEDISENIGSDISLENILQACESQIWLKINVEGDYTHTGISIKRDENGKYYYTQLFYK